MTPKPKIVSRDEWLSARRALLAKDRALTHQRDDVARQRRELPWVKVDQNYVFDTPRGPRSLADLFDGRSQLIVYQFMFGKGWELGCPNCSYLMDHVDGMLPHLNARDTTFSAISRAPLANIEAFRKRMGWRFPWASSAGNSFNYDFGTAFTVDQIRSGKVNYNYADVDAPPMEDFPGINVFYHDADAVYHTYGTFSRGLDMLVGTYNYLDLTPKGRDEDQYAFDMAWVRYHDEYGPGYKVDPKAGWAAPKGSLVTLGVGKK
jgi:predicted dithiol-disulfide oxidoreductase (DUF899 family)